MTYAEFVARFPEFARADPTRVAVILSDAEARTSEGVLGASYDEAVGLLAAHMLATQPGSVQSKLAGQADNKTVYMRRLDELTQAVVVALTV